jgi:hypothetical protein
LEKGVGRIIRKQATALERCDGRKLRGGGNEEMYRVCRKMLVAMTTLRTKRNRLSDLQDMINHAREECEWMKGGGNNGVHAEALGAPAHERPTKHSHARITQRATPEEKRAHRFQMQHHVGIARRDMGKDAAVIHKDEETGLALYLYKNHVGKMYVNYTVEELSALPEEVAIPLMDRLRFVNIHAYDIARWYMEPSHDSRELMRGLLVKAADMAGDAFAVSLRDLILRHEN